MRRLSALKWAERVVASSLNLVHNVTLPSQPREVAARRQKTEIPNHPKPPQTKQRAKEPECTQNEAKKARAKRSADPHKNSDSRWLSERSAQREVSFTVGIQKRFLITLKKKKK